MTTIARASRAALGGALTGLAAASAAAQQGTQRETPATRFTIRIENVSTPQTLKLSNGQTAPAPTAPGLWVVHTKGSPIFAAGRPERRMGLEGLAEDGDPSQLAARIASAPGVDGSGTFTIPVGDEKPGPALPGKAFEFTVTAHRGERLSIAMMFGQSNDLFYAFAPGGIDLFPHDTPLAGDITPRLTLWDAGTEANEEPGLGPNQAPRQPRPNTGPAERRLVGAARDGFTYPAVSQVVRVTVTPTAVAAMR